ncbi:MAG: hypothetical protein ACTHX2_01670 [Microbacterium sp.]
MSEHEWSDPTDSAGRPQLTWSEVEDLVSQVGGIITLDDLIAALIEFRDNPPEPDPPRRGRTDS